MSKGEMSYELKPYPAPQFDHWSLRQMIGDILRLLLPPPKLPKPASALPQRAPVELSSPWEPGCSAFWLDPELWSRTPEVDGRPEICWMFLDCAEKLAIGFIDSDLERRALEIRRTSGISA